MADLDVPPANQATRQSVQQPPADPEPALQPVTQRLVNLTDHPVVIFPACPGAPDDAGEPDTTGRSPRSLPPVGPVARVDDAVLRSDWLGEGDEAIRLSGLRRSRQVIDLPAPQRGTRFVVSRLTALAARHRTDLVFPFEEVRDEDGRIVGVRGLAAFRRRRLTVRRVRDWPAALWDRVSRRREPRPWLTNVMYSTATALLSATLALFPASLDFATAHGWGITWQTWTLRLAMAFGVLGLGLLGGAAWRGHRRSVVLAGRGTAYVIEEEAISWRYEERASVIAAITRGFPTVLRVPGPGELGDDWHWPSDASGASQWDARTDQLVRSFWAVHFNDDQITSNALFTWAPWPVAMAFGARATARRRGLVLHVRQRPSAGGSRRRVQVTDAAHDFLRGDGIPNLAEMAPAHAVEHHEARLAVTTAPLGEAAEQRGDAATEPGGEATAAGQAAGPGSPGAAHLLLLVVRITLGRVGPLDLDLAGTEPFTLGVCRSLAGTAIPLETHTIPVAEWRLVTRDPAAARVQDLPWAAFSSAAEAIAGWVVEQAAAHPGHVILLATRMPQEISVGLGVQLSQRAMERDPGNRWPRQAYPAFFDGQGLVIPDLPLGADSASAHRDPVHRA